MTGRCILDGAEIEVSERAEFMVDGFSGVLLARGEPALSPDEVVVCVGNCYAIWRGLTKAEQADRTSTARRGADV